MKEDPEHTARARLAWLSTCWMPALAYHTFIHFLGLLLGAVASPALFQLYVTNDSPALFYMQTFSQLEMSF